MITGFNTDVRSGDKVFHVQTEDKGAQKPVIVSLIYQKGMILDSYRTPYDAFQKSPRFSEILLRQILECQHRQLVLAIKNGQYQKKMKLKPFQEDDFTFAFPLPPETPQTEDKKVSAEKIQPPLRTSVEHELPPQPSETIRVPEKKEPLEPIPPPPEKTHDLPFPQDMEVAGESESPPQEESMAQAEPLAGKPTDSSYSLEGMMEIFKQEPIIPPSPKPAVPKTTAPNIQVLDVNTAIRLGKVQGLEICLESSREFVAGNPVDLHLFIQSRSSQIRLENVPVLIKIIGTNFVPRIYSGKTDKNGSLRISFTLPEYQLGSAALLVQASTSAGGDQVKYLIKKK